MHDNAHRDYLLAKFLDSWFGYAGLSSLIASAQRAPEKLYSVRGVALWSFKALELVAIENPYATFY